MSRDPSRPRPRLGFTVPLESLESRTLLNATADVGSVEAPAKRSATETVGVVACFSVSVMVRILMRPILPAPECRLMSSAGVDASLCGC